MTWLNKLLGRRGFTLIEVVIAASILAVALLGMGAFQAASLKSHRTEKDHAFAVQKAVQIMEEMLAYQVTNGDTGGIDALADGQTNYKFMLTIDPKAASPSGPLSGNFPLANGSYKFVRQIQVNPMLNEKGARQIVVSIFYSDNGLTPNANGGALATVTNIVKAKRLLSVPTQVYDLFLINIENTIGWWCEPSLLEPTMLGTINFLQSNNPGLEIRTHWIRRMSYGRDPYYTPTINAANAMTNTAAVPLSWIYFYPGNMDGVSFKYNPNTMNGQLMKDGSLLWGVTKPNGSNFQANGSSPSCMYANQWQYSYADQYNHAVRYPEEVEKFSAHPPSRDNEMSLRMLLEEMANGAYKNAIIVNLHGEGLPMVPARNYSDAARLPNDPTYNAYQNTYGVSGLNASDISNDASRMRLVTHPQRIVSPVNKNDNIGWVNANTVGLTTNDTVAMNVFPYLSSSYTSEPARQQLREAKIVLRNVANNLTNWNTGYPDLNGTWYGNAGKAPYYWGPADVNGTILGPDARNNPYPSDTNWTYYNGGGVPSGWYYGPMNKMNKTPPGVKGGGGSSKYPDNIEIDVTDASGSKPWTMIWPQGKSRLTSLTYDSNASNTYLRSAPQVFVNGGGTNSSLGGGTTNPQPNQDVYDGDVVIALQNLQYASNVPTLHGFNYYPDPALNDFSQAPSGQIAKTMKFRILFRLQSGQVVETMSTIGDDNDLSHHMYPNRSRTFTYAQDSSGYPLVPFTERYQLMGDPRDNPYEDARDPANQWYNRYFANLTGNAYTTSPPAGFTGNTFPSTADNYIRTNGDLPRYFELWRRALLGANSIYVNSTGYSFYYSVLGGELETSQAGGGGSWSISSLPYTGSIGSTSIANMYGSQHIVAKPDGSWYAKAWLGEMYPDDAASWSDWHTRGNIASSVVRRVPYNDASVPGWVPGRSSNPNVAGAIETSGCISFFNGGGAGNRSNSFNHIFASDTGTLSTNGQSISTTMKLTLNNTDQADRPVVITDGGQSPEWNSTEATSWGTLLEWTLMNNGIAYSWDSRWSVPTNSGAAAAPITIRRGGQAGYAVMDGLAPTGSGSTLAVARDALAFGMSAYFDAAYPTFQDGTAKGHEAPKLMPYLKVTAPADGDQCTTSTLQIKFHEDWQRWDGATPYSNQYPDGGAGLPYVTNKFKPRIVYNLKYSTDSGATWHYTSDNARAYPGVYDANHDLGVTVNAGSNWDGQCSWSFGSKSQFPNGAYVLRLEGFRSDGTNGGNFLAFNGTSWNYGSANYEDGFYSYHQITVGLSR